jgi:hypothetical protein
MKKNNNFPLISFGCIFFLAGFAFFYMLVLSQLIDAWKMQSWHSTKAQLSSAKVTSHQSRNDDGSSTTMYKVIASYQYLINNQNYNGHRPSLSDSSTSDQNEHYQLLSKIKYQQKHYNHITIWYDPSEPSQSIIDKSIQWKTLLMITTFCSVFMLIGGGIIFHALNKNKNKPSKESIDPSKPWTTRQEWASPIIYSNAHGSVKLAWFFVALSLCFCGVFAIALFGSHPVATGFSILIGSIPLLVLKRAIRLQREWKQFKKVPLHLSNYPGVIGGDVGGEIIIPIRSRSQNKYKLTLKCVNHYTSGSGKNRSSHQVNIYSHEEIIKSKTHLDGSQIKFNFEIPAQHPQSSEPDNNYHQWMLTVKAIDNDNTFNRHYEIPVFITKDSKTVTDELNEKPLTEVEKNILEERLSIIKDGDVIYLKTPGSKVGLVFAGMGLLFTVIGISIAIFSELFFGTIFALFGSLFLALGLWIWGKNCKVKVSPIECEVQTYWFSQFIKLQKLSPQDIDKIITYLSSSSSNTSGQTDIKYGLKIKTTQGSNVDLGGEFNSDKNATHMKQEIEKVMSL